MSFTSFDAPGATNTQATCVNTAGVCAGTCLVGSAAAGFVRNADGTFPTFDPGGVLSTAVTIYVADINDSGVVAGTYRASDYSTHCFIRAVDGTITTFDPIVASPIYAVATAIDSAGDVCGYYSTGADPKTHGFVRAAGGAVTAPLDDPSAGSGSAAATYPLDINDSGELTGCSTPDNTNFFAFVIASPYSAFTDFSAFTNNSGGYAINASGQVAGGTGYLTSDPVPPRPGTVFVPGDCFLRATGGGTTIFDPSGISKGCAVAINDAGAVAGWSRDDADTYWQGFYRAADGTVTPFSLAGSPAGTTTAALALNASGVLCGYYDAGSGVHAFIGTPDFAPTAPPNPLAGQMSRYGGLGPILLLDVITVDAFSYHWASIPIASASALGIPVPITGTPPPWNDHLGISEWDDTYLPWLVKAGPFSFSRSMQADTTSFTVQNESGNTIQRDMSQIVTDEAFEGAVFIFREWNLDAGAVELEMHGHLSADLVTETVAQFSAENLFNPSDYQGLVIVGETCPWRYASAACADNTSNPCQNTWLTCRQPSRFGGIVVTPVTIQPGGNANTSTRDVVRNRQV